MNFTDTFEHYAAVSPVWQVLILIVFAVSCALGLHRLYGFRKGSDFGVLGLLSASVAVVSLLAFLVMSAAGSFGAVGDAQKTTVLAKHYGAPSHPLNGDWFTGSASVWQINGETCSVTIERDWLLGSAQSFTVACPSDPRG